MDTNKMNFFLIFSLLTITIICLGVYGCKNLKNNSKTNMTSIKVDLEAAGAFYFNIFSDGCKIMELRNCLLNEYGTFTKEAPSVVQLINPNSTNKSIKLRGWLMGGNPSTATWVLEEKQLEYHYQIAAYSIQGQLTTIPIEAPNKSDFWELYGIERNPKQTNAAIVFHRPLTSDSDRRTKKEELWVVTFDLVNGKILQSQIISMTLLDAYSSSLSVNDQNIVLVGFENAAVTDNDIVISCLDNISLNKLWEQKINVAGLQPKYNSSNSTNQVEEVPILQGYNLTKDMFRLSWGIKMGNLSDYHSRLIALGMTNESGVDAESFVYVSSQQELNIYHKKSPVAQIIPSNLPFSCLILKSATVKIAGTHQVIFDGIDQWTVNNQNTNLVQNDNSKNPSAMSIVDGQLIIAPSYGEKLDKDILTNLSVSYSNSLHRSSSPRVVEKEKWVRQLPPK
jgi:hypothetical protein